MIFNVRIKIHIMTKFFFTLILGVFCFIGNAQEWETDIEVAKTLAKDRKAKIILVFQGSDWCAPCIKLDKEIWSTDEFKVYAEKNYVMLQADFPRKKNNRLAKEQQDKNNLLAEKYNKQGFFPHVVVLDETGKVIGRTGYKKLTPTEYIKHLNDL